MTAPPDVDLFTTPPRPGPPMSDLDRQLRDELTTVIAQHDADRPRSRQTAIGPSAIGEPCTRRLGYELAAWPPANHNIDPLAAISGTALHALLADTFGRRPDRWAVEMEVEVRPGLRGCCDLYDRRLGIVLDWKTMSDGSYRRFIADGPTGKHVTQAHAYGVGVRRAGLPVDRVGVVAIPREKPRLDRVAVWTDTLDPANVDRSLVRVDAITTLIADVDLPAAFALLDRTPTTPFLCNYCPFHAPRTADPSVGCPGPKD